MSNNTKSFHLKRDSFGYIFSRDNSFFACSSFVESHFHINNKKALLKVRKTEPIKSKGWVCGYYHCGLFGHFVYVEDGTFHVSQGISNKIKRMRLKENKPFWFKIEPA